MQTDGIHIIADCYGCDFSHFIDSHSLPVIVEKISSIITDAGFTVLGTLHHSFGDRAFSIVCMLAESHVSIHSWPEHGYISFDVYTCNYFADNTTGTERIYRELVRLFAPKEVKKEIIERSMAQG